MPNRILREGINSSESVVLLKWDEEVFYRRLHSVVDDYGRHEGAYMLLKSKCYPLHENVRTTDIARWLAACVTVGLISEYVVSGKRYIQIEKFGQKTRTASKCPPPSAANDVQPFADKCQQMPANDLLVGGVCGVGVGGVSGGEGVVVKPREELGEAVVNNAVTARAREETTVASPPSLILKSEQKQPRQPQSIPDAGWNAWAVIAAAVRRIWVCDSDVRRIIKAGKTWVDVPGERFETCFVAACLQAQKKPEIIEKARWVVTTTSALLRRGKISLPDDRISEADKILQDVKSAGAVNEDNRAWLQDAIKDIGK